MTAEQLGELIAQAAGIVVERLCETGLGQPCRIGAGADAAQDLGSRLDPAGAQRASDLERRSVRRAVRRRHDEDASG